MSFLVPSMVLAKLLTSTPPCEIVLGVEADHEALRRELEARELRMERAPSCEGPSVSIDREAHRLVVRLTDQTGRELERRVLEEEKTVAALIESWMRDDLAASLLEPATPPVPIQTALQPEPETAPATEAVRPESAAIRTESQAEPAPGTTFGVGLGAELGADLDGNPWFGVAGLVRPWPSTLTPLFLARVQHNAIAGASSSTGAARTGFELIALLEPRFAIGSFSLRPAAGAGIGLLHSTRGEDRTCAEACALVVQDDFAVTRFAPRIELRVALGHPLGGGFFVELSAGATLNPLAEVDALMPAYASELPSAAEQALLALPGEPLVLARGTLAIHWEGQ